MNDRIGYWLFEKHGKAVDYITLTLAITAIVCSFVALVVL